MCASAQDDLGLGNGYTPLRTARFDAQLVSDAQVLASLKVAGHDFDFLPYDYLSRRARNGQHHLGDITFRYRQDDSEDWIDGSSAASRQPIINLGSSKEVLSSAALWPTLPDGPLNITRDWFDISGDLGLRFTLQNTGSRTIEIGSLGFPIETNNIFTNRTASEMLERCSLAEPYIGMDAGHIRVAPTRGTGTFLVITPLYQTPLEAHRFLPEVDYPDTRYGSQTYEGMHEWQVLTKAWAENEWEKAQPWNEPSSIYLQPGDTVRFGLRLSATDDVRDIDATVESTGTPVALGVPGYVIPRDSSAQLFLRSSFEVTSMKVEPPGALTIDQDSTGFYVVTPSHVAWGRARLTVVYAGQKIQTIHFYITKPGPEVVADLGRFLLTEQWYTDESDPFGRAPSVMSYDYEVKAIVTQDPRVYGAGLSDESGAGSFLAATIKQAVQPSREEITKLESFVDETLWGQIQTADYRVRKCVFYYDPDLVPGFSYRPDIDWTTWTSWNRDMCFNPDRSYNYVHVAASYWGMYRAARAYPGIFERHSWDWYLDHAFQTVVACYGPGVGHQNVGLMAETVFGEILKDLAREGFQSEAANMTEIMRRRANHWETLDSPYGSEMPWDSTGQEGVFYWSKYFGHELTALKTVNTVLGYMHSVPHWGWNGNARRYWDSWFAGKLRRIERQIHHYGSGLNALVLLGQFRADPTDTYLGRVGYGGISAPLTNINEEGFASSGFHSWPETLDWDAYSSDYGPGFAALALASGTYVMQDDSTGLGLLAYGGILSRSSNDAIVVEPRDAIRQRVFIGPLGLLVSIDAGIIESLRYSSSGPSASVSVTLSQLEHVPMAQSALLWLETTVGDAQYRVSTEGMEEARGGWTIPFRAERVTVDIRPL